MSVDVNCWFCCEDSRVPVYQRNGWECPKCDQYNGFTADGDYNVAIGCADEGGPRVRYNAAMQLPAPPATQLCRRCSQNQALKVRQLADFEPAQPQRYDEELQLFRRRLDELYRLCAPCEALLQQTLDGQDRRIQPAIEAWTRQQEAAQSVDAAATTNTINARNRAVSKLSRSSWLSAVKYVLGLLRILGMAALVILLAYEAFPLHFALLVLPFFDSSVVVEALEHYNRYYSQMRYGMAAGCCVLWILSEQSVPSISGAISACLWAHVFVVEACSDQLIGRDWVNCFQLAIVGLLLVRRLSFRKQFRSPSARATKPTAFRPSLNCATRMTAASPSLRPADLPTSTREDCSLNTLSLGSAVRSPVSGGVFSLRRYSPTAGSRSLFSPTAAASGQTRGLLAPARLRSDIQRSSWIAGDYWSRDASHQLDIPSRGSSQSSGFVDSAAPGHQPTSASFLSSDDVASLISEAPSCACSTYSRRPQHWTPPPAGISPGQLSSCSGAGWSPSASPGQMSRFGAASVTSAWTADTSLMRAASESKAVVVALVLGFSLAFNMFVLLFVFMRDRL